ncbi:hypothetical protein EYC80_002398 [Monilinia laxa]|uniref:Uncharacterized protein n=1 Tax=Monilinia laxa TaxID=61186 RepID=A0A5N6K3U2_MONLA|nr:hypothetical protein EYC80_002398 [Monilinia laxa]
MSKSAILVQQWHISQFLIQYLAAARHRYAYNMHKKQLPLGISRRSLATHAIPKLKPAAAQDQVQSKSPYNEAFTYIKNEQPLGTMRRVKVISIGAGVSGINMARALKRSGINIEHIVYDKNPDVGGTWLENCYPGCASDDPSHNYQFSHTPNPGWSSLFAPAGEIQDYLLGILRGSPEALEARRIISLYMASALNHDKQLLQSLIPKFPVGCRRVTPGIGYLNALTQSNVDVITTGIKELQYDGIKLINGDLKKVDAIICATGFNFSFIPRFPIIGEYGNLQDLWKDSPSKAYMSCMVTGMPNYITFLRPNDPLAHGAIPIITEQLSAFALKFIQKCQRESIASFRPLPAAAEEYAEHIAQFMPRTV